MIKGEEKEKERERERERENDLSRKQHVYLTYQILLARQICPAIGSGINLAELYADQARVRYLVQPLCSSYCNKHNKYEIAVNRIVSQIGR